MKKVSTTALMFLLVTGASLSQTVCRNDISDLNGNIVSSKQKYCRGVYNTDMTIKEDKMNSMDVAICLANDIGGMDEKDVKLLSDQIKMINSNRNYSIYFEGDKLNIDIVVKNGFVCAPIRYILKNEKIEYIKNKEILKINDKEIDLQEYNYLIKNGRMYIHVRVVEEIGYNVIWIEDPYNTVYITSEKDVDVDKLLLNKHGEWTKGDVIKVPVYRKGSSLPQTDMRNWHYATMAGLKWGVSPALLIAIRNHENPSSNRDGFALGVVAYKWKGIWVQYDQGAKIIKRIANRQKWNPINPSQKDIQRCNRVYAESTTWHSKVWRNYTRAIVNG